MRAPLGSNAGAFDGVAHASARRGLLTRLSRSPFETWPYVAAFAKHDLMRNQRLVDAAPSTNQRQRVFRLRHVLLIGIIVWGGLWLVPRARATLTLHDRATAFADYALCLVGQTGPDVVRRRPLDLLPLIRRRVIAALPEDVPLASCFKLAERLGVSYSTLKLHQVRAADIAEYHNDPTSRARYSLTQFELPEQSLRDLAEAAWPFVRQGYAELMVATSHAKHAAHPAGAPPPGWGSGLPASAGSYHSAAAFGDTWVVSIGSGAHRQVLWSANRGIDWRPGGERMASELLDRCMADEDGRGFSLSKLNDGQRVVVSHGPGAPPQVALLAPKGSRLGGVSCDHSALTATLVGPDRGGFRDLVVRLCPFREACRDLPLPAMAGAALYYPADVARMNGDTVLSRSVGGITRVTTSRDDGKTWSPWIVVYDGAEQGQSIAAPFRLLAVGDALLLYSGARQPSPYPLLVSDDHGASFHAPIDVKSGVTPGTAVAQMEGSSD